MDKLLDVFGNVAAALGILICLVAGVARVAGNHYVFGYEAITLFIGMPGKAPSLKYHQMRSFPIWQKFSDRSYK